MKMKNFLPAIVLTSICIVVALILAVTNAFTSGVIEARRTEEIKKSLETVSANAETATFYDVADAKNYPTDAAAAAKLAEIKATVDAKKVENKVDTVKSVYYDTTNDAYAVTIEKQGYASVISMTVGVDKDGKIIKAVIISEQESHGKTGVNELPEQFAGKDADGIDDVQAVSGATVSSTAIKEGTKDALYALGFAVKNVSYPTSDEKLIEYSKALISGSNAFEDITPEEENKNIKKVFREKSGKGYSVYVHTYAAWGGTLESETLVAFDAQGTIVGVKKIMWTVGHGPDDNPPAPSDEVVDAFFQSFVGKNLEAARTAELVTHATGTASNVREAIVSAAEHVSDLVAQNVFPVARFVGIMAVALAVSAIAAVIFIKRRRARK